MSVRLPDAHNPYASNNPFAVLGVPPSATARELHAAHVERLADVDYSKLDDATRIVRREEINQAYNVLRDVRSRVSVLMFQFDETVGREGLKQVAQQHRDLDFDFGRILTCSTSVFPHSPEPLPPSGKKVTMKRSLQYKVDPRPFEPDLKGEAMSSITFER